MSVGNQAQAINFANKNLVLVIGENMDLGGDDAGPGTELVRQQSLMPYRMCSLARH